MSIVISLGSNLEDRANNLKNAINDISHLKDTKIISKSKIYESKAVDYLNQPDFLNQLIEIESKFLAEDLLNELLNIEKKYGRVRNIDKGPRIIDLDIIFYDQLKIKSKHLTIPHEHWDKRSFIIEPLKELNYFKENKESLVLPAIVDNTCWYYNSKK